MKNSLKYLMTLGLVGSMFFVTGCPEDNNGEEGCTTSEDCAEGQTCNVNSNTCEETSSSCSDDTACMGNGEYCLGEGDNKVCRMPTSCGELDASISASYCANQLSGFNAEKEIAFCDTTTDADTPTCQSKDKLEYRVISVTDFSNLQADGSVDDAMCITSVTPQGVKDPGTDLISVSLLDADNETIGFAKAVEFEVGTGAPDFVDFETIFDGIARPASDFTGVCPARKEVGGENLKFREDSVLTLGCGGALYVEFLGSDGNVVLIDPATHKIEVTEFGPYCNSADGTVDDTKFGTDKFGISLCATVVGDTAAEIGAEDCVYPLTENDEQGFVIVDVSSNADIEADPSDTSFVVVDGDQ